VRAPGAGTAQTLSSMPLYGALSAEEEGVAELYHSAVQPQSVEPPPRKSLLQRFGMAGTALLGVAALVGVTVNARKPDVDLSGRAPPGESTAAELALSPQLPPGMGDHKLSDGNTVLQIDGVSYTVTEVDLTSHPVISNYVAKNVESAVLPDMIQLLWNQNLTDGDIGEEASAGYVVLSMAHGNFMIGNIDACYTVVMTLQGEIVQAQVAPTQDVYGNTYFTRFEGMKMKDTTTVLLAQNTDIEGGNFYSWDLTEVLESGSTETVEPLPIWSAEANVTGGSHDIQYYTTDDGEEVYLVINNNLDKLFMYNINGTLKWEYVPPYIHEPMSIHYNHAQIARDKQGELAVFISIRDMNCISKLNFTSGLAEWTLGGMFGEFNVTDIDGRLYGPHTGHGAFTHQHNAEYIGDGKFALFDNGYNGSWVRDSRMLILDVDEANYEAKVTWEWSTGVHAQIFGDADPLPTGNVVGTFWPATVHTTSPDIRESYEASAVEVTRNGSIAWMLGVKGTHAMEPDYDRFDGEAPIGWAFYSVERFYTSLLLKNARTDTSSGVVSFSVYNTHRQQFDLAATVVISCGDFSTSDDITILAHWQETAYETTLKRSITQACDVTVTTEAGDSATAATELVEEGASVASSSGPPSSGGSSSGAPQPAAQSQPAASSPPFPHARR